jgi:cell wall-associated NlpC family hydrolase
MSQTNNSNGYSTEEGSAFKQAVGQARKRATQKIAKKAVKVAATKTTVAAGTSLGGPVLFGIIAGALFLVATTVICAFLLLSSVSEEDKQKGQEEFDWGEEISEIGANEIPAKLIPIYQAAGKKYGVPWNLLAAEHRVETVFSTLPTMTSPVGAIGHMQFMPLTWVGWGYGGDRLGNANVPESILTDPIMIKKYGGYGVDANGDGKADPNNLEDAIFSAANYLAANGAAKGKIREAVFSYNHADWYVEEVLDFADQYVKGYVAIEENTQQKGEKVVEVGKKYIGHSEYIFGGGRNRSDIASGRFDCSSFVHWAYAQEGIDLGPLNSTSTETLKHLGKPISPKDMKPGDLVFFDTYKPDGHVGIYLGNGKFIGAQTNTGVAVADLTKGYWKEKFNGRVKRL